MWRQVRFGWVAALMAAGWAADGEAQAAAWEDLGPPGGAAFALAVSPADPQVIWAVTTWALYRSTDAGATWARASTDRPHFRSSAELALSPGDADTAFLRVSGEMLRRTTDGGVTWQVTGPLAAAATVATVPGADPFTVLAAGDGQTLVRSSDGGETWDEVVTTIDPNPTSSAVRQVVPAAAASGVVYARTWFALHRSDDGGATWQLASAERLPPVAVHPEEPLTVYALSGFVSASRRSDDGGVSWRTLDAAPSSGRTRFAFDPVDPATLHAATGDGLHRSTDRGESWTSYGGLGEWDRPEAMAVDPSDARAVVVGGTLHPPGVWRSTDAGGSWAASAEGLPGAEVFSLTTDPAAPEDLYVAGWRLERTRDRGATWETLLDRPVTSVAVDPRSSRVLWAATGWPGLLHSTDDGGTWTTVSDLRADRIVVDSHRDGTVYAREWRSWHRSDDSGATWVLLHTPAIGVLVPHPARAGFLLAGGSGIARSRDWGETWEGVSGLPMVPPPCTVRPCDVYDLALHPLCPGSLVAATECGLFSSDDWGATWRLSDDGLPPVSCEMNVWGCYACDGPRVVEANPARPGMLVAVAGAELYSSLDFGATWRLLPIPGLPDREALWTGDEVALLAFTGDGGGLLVGTDAGVYALWLDRPRRPAGRWR